MILNCHQKLGRVNSLENLNVFLENLDPMIGRFGGRRFVSRKTAKEGSICYNDLIKKTDEIFKKFKENNNPPIYGDNSKVNLQEKQILKKLKHLNDSANNIKCSILIRLITKIKSLWGKLFIDRVFILRSLETVAYNGELRKVTPKEVLALNLENPNPKYKLLRLDELKKTKLFPDKKLHLDNATYYFSKLFSFDPSYRGEKSSYCARLAFVEVDGKVYPRVFYQSNSQGIWRVLPSMSKGGIVVFGKGKIETDIQLPLKVNAILCSLSKEKTDIRYHNTDMIKTFEEKTWDERLLTTNL